jgi:transposase
VYQKHDKIQLLLPDKEADQMKKNKNQYHELYRRYVAELVLEHGRRPAELERELGISYSSIMRWTKTYKDIYPETKTPEEADLETRLKYKKKLEALEKANRELEEEREILRKLTGSFPKDSQK